MRSTPTHLDELHEQLQRLTQSLRPLGSIIKTEPHLSYLDACWQATAAMQTTLDAVQHDASKESQR